MGGKWHQPNVYLDRLVNDDICAKIGGGGGASKLYNYFKSLFFDWLYIAENIVKEHLKILIYI